MRALWISAIAMSGHGGGAGAVSLGLRRVVERELGIAVTELAALERRRKARGHRLWRVVSLARALVSGRPAKALFAEAPGFRRRLRALLAVERFDLIVVDGVDTAIVLPDLPQGVPVLLVAHNVEHALFAEQLQRQPALLRAVLGEPDRYRRFEIAAAQRADAIVTLSDADALAYRAFAADKPIAQIRPSFAGSEEREEASLLASSLSRPVRLGFPATMSWWPNAEALDWLLREVWTPAPHRELHLFGHGSAARSDAGLGIVGHGFVADIADVWRGFDVLVLPMRSGGGVNIKLCEALFWHKPALATPLGLRGLGLGDEPAVAVAEDAAAWRAALEEAPLRALSAQQVRAQTAALFTDAAAAADMSKLLAQIGIATQIAPPSRQESPI